MRDAARRGGHRGGRGEGEQEEDGDTSGHGDADNDGDGEDGGGLLEEEDLTRSVYTTGRPRRLMKYQAHSISGRQSHFIRTKNPPELCLGSGDLWLAQVWQGRTVTNHNPESYCAPWPHTRPGPDVHR